MTTSATSSPELVRVLLIDDDPGDFQMTRAMIEQIDRPNVKYEVEWVATFEEAVDALETKAHDLYLVDYFLEDHDGLDLVRRAREMGMRNPLIMLTGRGSHEVDVEAMKAGASDYLVKGEIDPATLERSLRYAMERMRAEAALRESEERHRGMFDHLPIGLYRVAPDGKFMDANPALVRILGYPDGETLQSHYAATLYVNPADLERFEDLIERFGVARGFETLLDRHDGERIWVRITARAHRDTEGVIHYLEGAVEDVTEERTARELHGSAEQFDAIFDQSSLPILLVDLEGTILRTNPAFLRAFGYEEDELPSKRMADIVVEEQRSRMESDVLDLSESTVSSVRGERDFVGGDGNGLRVRIHGVLVRDSAGEADHLMFFFEEIGPADG